MSVNSFCPKGTIVLTPQNQYYTLIDPVLLPNPMHFPSLYRASENQGATGSAKDSPAFEAMPVASTITGKTQGAGVDPNYAPFNFVERAKNYLGCFLCHLTISPPRDEVDDDSIGDASDNEFGSSDSLDDSEASTDGSKTTEIVDSP